MKQNTTIVRRKGINRNTLWFIGIVLAFTGMMSRGVLQGRLLGVYSGNMMDVLKILDMNGGMTAATTALVLEAIESMGVPIFAILTVGGFERTESLRKYFLRVLALAFVSEIPYNLALSVKVIDPTSKNPIFGVALCLLMLGFFRRYATKTFGGVIAGIAVFAAAVFWAMVLQIKFGIMLLILVAVLWLFRKRAILRYWLAAAAAVSCCIGNPLYMFAPFGFLISYAYNEEEGPKRPAIHYAMYPMMLLIIYVAGMIM